MKDNSFERAMNQILGQHEAEQKAEIRAKKRAQTFGRVRAVFSFLLVAAILAVGFNYRTQLGNKLGNIFNSKPAAEGTTGQAAAALKGAAQYAATRDAVVDAVGK